MADDIARAFVDGLYEVYSVLYQEILFYPIDPTNLTNVYGESKGKKFLDPVTIFAKVKKAPRGPGRDENEEELDLYVQVPRKSFEIANIPLTAEGLDQLKRGMFKSFDGLYYSPVSFTPYGGTFQSTEMIFNFNCRQVDSRYIR